MKLIRGLAMVALVALSTIATSAQAGTRDGSWSVYFKGTRGCSDAQRVNVQIVRGRIQSSGASGRVGDDGSVDAALNNGLMSGIGGGKLSRRAGRGWWKGDGCSGYWTAKK